MNPESRKVRNLFLLLSLFITLPTALIVGVNTLFLLDGGLSNAQAFAANAFYTLGLVLFEIPTGVVADTWGRRTSYLLGTVTQLGGNLLYFYMWYSKGPFFGWAIASVILGLGYTFFSGALEAWLVDALQETKYTGRLDDVFAKQQVIDGVAMLVGTIAGGYIAQMSRLGAPYLVRGGIQIVGLVVALALMKELGFRPQPAAGVIAQVKGLLRASWDLGLRNPPVRWTMLAAPFYLGTGIYGFYAAQPYLLELYGRSGAIGIAGIAAAGIAGTQILGGFAVPYIGRRFTHRTHILLASAALTVLSLVLMGTIRNFYLVVGLLILWALAYAATLPVRQAYMNALIPSDQRATVLSFDSMISSTGGVIFQPVLGRVADLRGYAASYVVSGVVAILSLPFLVAARRTNVDADRIPRS
jgi:MFS family permease